MGFERSLSRKFITTHQALPPKQHRYCVRSLSAVEMTSRIITWRLTVPSKRHLGCALALRRTRASAY